MKYTVEEFTKQKFADLVGDGTKSTPDRFFIQGINWCLNELPRIPRLEKLFTKHCKANLDANLHYKWSLNDDFRRLNDIEALSFVTSTGGEPCPYKVCNLRYDDFVKKHPFPELKHPGQPCEYAIQKEGDEINLVFDRPLNIPMMVSYVACGCPKPVTSMDDEIPVDISYIAENLIVGALRTVWYKESDDFTFSENIEMYLDNKAIPEAIQQLHQRWGNENFTVIGG